MNKTTRCSITYFMNTLLLIITAIILPLHASEQPEINPEGTWTITEMKSPKNITYTGTVTFEKIEDIHTFFWDTSIGKIGGIGFYRDNTFFGAFGRGDTFGVELFKIGSDGNLDGTWTFPGGQGMFGREVTENGKPGQLEGSYTFSGIAQGGMANYTGTLDITKKGDVYYLVWNANNMTFPGVGLRTGDWLVCGFGRTLKEGFGTIFYAFDGNTAAGQITFDGKESYVSEKLMRTVGTPDSPANTPSTQPAQTGASTEKK